MSDESGTLTPAITRAPETLGRASAGRSVQALTGLSTLVDAVISRQSFRSQCVSRHGQSTHLADSRRCGFVRLADLGNVMAAREPLDEQQRRLSDLPPAGVDRQRVAAAGHLDDLGHTLVPFLLL